MDNNLTDLYENINEINNQISKVMDEVITDLQNNYLKSSVGDAINQGLDFGIRQVFPDFVEDQIINFKNNLVDYGIKDGIQQTVEDAINFGKNALNIVNGNFENITQAQQAISSGGIIDNISDLLDFTIDGLKSANVIDSSLAKTITKEKNNILKNIEKNIEKSFTNQINNLEKLEKYMENWKGSFESKDFSGMQNEYNKMQKVIDSLMPIENTLNDYRTIENLHNLIKNNGKDFNLTEEQLELSKKLF